MVQLKYTCALLLQSTNALFAKIVFYTQNLNLWGKHLQKMADCNKYMTWPVTHDWIRHLSCTGLNVCRLQPIQMKEILLFKCSGACFRYILIYSANVFLLHSGIPANVKQSKNVGKRMETAVLYHSPFVFGYIQSAILTIQTRPTKLNNWPFYIKYWYKKVVKTWKRGQF